MRADDLTRELGKALEALRWTEKHLMATNEGNAALHCNPKVFYSPLTTQVHEAVLSLERVTADLGSDAPNEPGPDGWAEQRREFAADIIEAFDVPGWVGGSEAEREVLRRQLTRALTAEHQRRASEQLVASPEEHCAGFADAVMPIVAELLEQRDRWRNTVGRAYRLAYRWEGAYGSSMFLVRAAGAELRDELDESGAVHDEVVHSIPDMQASGLPGADYLAAAECAALHTRFSDNVRQCIRAAQHRGDHIDEHGFHWSDTVAVYPVDDSQGPPNQGPLTGIEVRDPCPYCEDCPLIPRALMADHIREQHPDVTLSSRENGRALPPPDGGIAEDGLRRRCEELHARLDDAEDRAHTAQRNAEAADRVRAETQRDRDQHAAVLREVLAAFDCVKSLPAGDVLGYQGRAIDPADFDRWRSVVAPTVEQPWWEQVTELRAELARAEEELRRYTEAESADAAAGSYAHRAEQAERQRDKLLAEVQRLGDWCRAVSERATTAEADRDRWHDELAVNEADRVAAVRRAEQAEAAIERVRAIPRLPHHSQQTGELGRAYTRGWESVISAIDTALADDAPREHP